MTDRSPDPSSAAAALPLRRVDAAEAEVETEEQAPSPGERPEAAPERPAHVPEKFWDAEKGELRTDALVKSYGALERRLSGMVRVPGADADAEELESFRRALGVPETPEAYDIRFDDEAMESDAEVNRRLHEAGFSNAQAQLVYDLAVEHLVPLVEQAAGEFEAQRQTDRLVQHFGGEEKWREVSRQLAKWGRVHLPEAALKALSATYEGVMALHQMMTSNEPALARGGAPAEGPRETELRQMMRDPRYWRDRDPVFVEQVSDGFRRLYGAEG